MTGSNFGDGLTPFPYRLRRRLSAEAPRPGLYPQIHAEDLRIPSATPPFGEWDPCSYKNTIYDNSVPVTGPLHRLLYCQTFDIPE